MCDLWWGHVGLGLIVLKVGCRMSIPISAGVGLEGQADEQMMGRTDGVGWGRWGEWMGWEERWAEELTRDGWTEGRGQYIWSGGIWWIDEWMMKWIDGVRDGEGGDEWRWNGCFFFFFFNATAVELMHRLMHYRTTNLWKEGEKIHNKNT